ncbi:MAG: carbohydrate-binding family 9-like protein [Bacteroidetes bacterium]|nr:carbohydrate-binding family 9-like protein [Bacteroidota bacterium]
MIIPQLSGHPFFYDIKRNARRWQAAFQLQLSEVTDGSKPVHPTTVRLGMAGDIFCVRFECQSTSVYATHTRAGSPVWEEEAAEVFLQPPDQSNIYYEIDLNPLNTLTQLKVFNDGAPGASRRYEGDKSWNCPGIETRVWIDGTLNAKGQCRQWIAEMAIPIKNLLSSDGSMASGWRANFFRIDAGLLPFSYQAWQPTGAIDFHRMEHFVQLVFQL